MAPVGRPVFCRSFLFVLFIILSLAVGGCGSGGGTQSSEALPSYCPVSSLSAGLPQSVGNDPPIAYRQQVYTDDDTACDVTFYACDPDQPLTSDGLSWVVDSSPTVGSVTALAGDYYDPVIQYIPRPGFTGTDSFYYSVSDGEDVSATKEIRVHIAPNKILQRLDLTPPDSANMVEPMSVGEPAEPANTSFIALAHYDNGASIDVSDLVRWVVTIVIEPEGSAEPMSVPGEAVPDPQSIEDILDLLNNYQGPPLNVDVTAQYSYGGIGLSSTVMLVVGDITPPDLIPPADITIEATGLSTLVELGVAMAVDLVEGQVVATNDSNGWFSLGTTQVQWTATDSKGNTVTAYQFVTVVDTSPPAITTDPGSLELPPPADLTVEATGTTTAVVLAGITAVDVVDGTVTVSSVPPAPFNLPMGVTSITWTATDSRDNSASVVQNVTVVDTIPPDIVAPADITVTSSGSAVSVELGTALASDLVDGDVPVSCDAPDEFEPGTTTVTWTAEDSSGNSASTTQSVNVVTVMVSADLEYTGDQVVTIYDEYLYLQATLYPEEGQIPFDDPASGTVVWFHIYTFDQMPMPGGTGAYINVGPVDVAESMLHPGIGVAGYSMSLPAELGTNEENYKILVELGEGSPVSGLSQEATLTVYAPSDRFFTGGGTVADPETGEDNNFGFTIKFLDNQDGIPVPKGNILYVRQDTLNGFKWRVLSESLDGAGFYPYGPEGGTVAITEGLCRVESHDLIAEGDPIIQSGLDCVMKVEDLDTSGISADTFRLELRYSDGVPYSPLHMAGELLLTGGNVMVHDQ